MKRSLARTGLAALALGGALAGASATAAPAAAEEVIGGHFGTAIGCDKAGRGAVASDDWTIGWECDRVGPGLWILYLEKGPSPR